ncbi:glycosyltransferase [Aestuariivita boseongensis]|uniref:glycosyltransferase n=1 Tax=Aestuariivita boseongensis TaxID=1470562 RepID=UPI00067FF525|nr:glycosyltransferase [Aestuariivita boseongensis]
MQDKQTFDAPVIDAVVIGRNEGARLVAAFESLHGKVRRIIYVDSGSTDGSVDAARAIGAEVVELDTSLPFTAARARNAGLSCLDNETDFVQILDGDCALRQGWISDAITFLLAHPEVAVVCGRRRERFSDASIYNRLADAEWDTPVGQTKACGGDAMMRFSALRDVGFYREELIAGEEPELCVRLRKAGWKIWRLDSEMTWHDAQMTRFSQWWRRTRRAGYAFAEGAALHGAPPERHWVTETRRAMVWGLGLPAIALVGGAFVPLLWLLLLAYPLQILRLSGRMGMTRSAFTVFGKCAEALGALEYWMDRAMGRKRKIIEYK